MAGSQGPDERGVSGGVPLLRREEGCKLAFLRPGDTVIISKLDRMFRDARDALNVIADWDTANINLIINGYGNVTDKANLRSLLWMVGLACCVALFFLGV